MTSPVLQALANARAQEEEQRELSICSSVATRLNLPAVEGDTSEWPVFAAWCHANNIRPYPARPASVAYFVLDNLLLGIDRLRSILRSVSVVHQNVADPTLGPAVAAALHQIAPIAPPRSWPKQQKSHFLELSYETQAWYAQHEDKREKEVRRAQNVAAELRNKLKKIERKDAESKTAA